MQALCKPVRLTTATALALAAVAPATAQILDTFGGAFRSQEVYYASGPPSQSVPEHTVAAPVPGGTRRLQLVADLAAPGSSFAAINGGDELWAFTSGGQRLNFSLAYGTQSAMNLNLASAGVLQLDVYLSSPMKLVVYATTQTTLGGDPDGSAASFDLPALFEQTVDFPLAAFSTNSSTGQPVNWADLDSLTFSLSAAGPLPSNSDAFWVRELSVVPVPEPASAALLAAGLALLLARRAQARRPQPEVAA